MRRFVILLFALLLFSSSALAGEIRSAGSVVLAERQTGDIRVVLYMTTW